MRTLSKAQVKFAATLFCLAQSGVVAAEEQWINANLGASQLWDSNFFRNPDDIAEQISVLTAGVGLSTEISRQRFTARWSARSYQHKENDQFDETLQDGVLRWNGAWAGQFTSLLEWTRDSYLVDRWEVPDSSDAVAKDDARFVLTRGSENRFSFQVGAHRARQTHSRLPLDYLDYEDNELFTALIYQTPAHSTLTLRYKSGDRSYLNKTVEDPNTIFDFNYDQFELENIWKISSKTSTSLMLSKLNRKGISDNSAGELAQLNLTWDATPKLQWKTGYSFKKPLQGDTIDMPSRVQNAFVSLAWKISLKLSLSSQAEKIQRNYENSEFQLVRTETQYNLVPLAITYLINDSFVVRLDTGWHKNISPIHEREYESLQSTLGLTVRF